MKKLSLEEQTTENLAEHDRLADKRGSVKSRGYDRLWLWFELSRAGWLTILRVLLHEMPDDWQGKMAKLLEQYEETFSNWPDGVGTQVQITQDDNVTNLHDWLNDYRHPSLGRIEKLKSKK